jgi:hypothetical protein
MAPDGSAGAAGSAAARVPFVHSAAAATPIMRQRKLCLPHPALRRLLLLGALGAQAAAPPAAAAADSTAVEFWPEINAYAGLDERSRLMVSAAGTRAMEGAELGSTLALQNAQFTLNFDYTLAPVLRRDVPRAEWSKNRLLWARLGYEYGSSGSGGPDAYRSDTGIVELNGRYPGASSLWWTSRLRVDLRNINGEPSQRYRLRAGAEWDTQLAGHPVAPYASVEALYDTRYGQWSRLTLKAGLETPIADAWRIEPYLALQLNRPNDDISRVLGLGLTLKTYFD